MAGAVGLRSAKWRGVMLPPFGNPELIIYILHYINITRDEKPFGLYRYLSEEKKVERYT